MTGYKILQLFCRYQRLNKANFALKINPFEEIPGSYCPNFPIYSLLPDR
jgi:hypothetical protein